MENSSHSSTPQKHCQDLTLDEAMEYEMKHGRLFHDPNIDTKKIRRTISNRLSAQRRRNKIVKCTSDLENMVEDLKELISILSLQVKSYKDKMKLLQLENYSLRPELEKRWNESRRLEMAIEDKRAEIKVLKELERSGHKNKLPSDSEAKETPDLRLGGPLINVVLAPRCNFFPNQQKNPRPAPEYSTIKQSGEEIQPAKQVEEPHGECGNVDQYINFNIALEHAADGIDGENGVAMG